jgi:hypothetical protein
MKQIPHFLIIGLLIGLFASSCSQGDNLPAVTESIPSPTVNLVEEEPTETISIPFMLLLAGPDSDPASLAETQALAAQIAQEHGLVFEHRQTLSTETAPKNLPLVVVLPPMSGLEELAQALPGTRFVALNMPNVVSSGNLVSVGEQINTDFQAFMAGYIAAVEAEDWRVGLVYVGDENGRQYRNAFLTGAIYFCGFCNPYYPPYYEYPLYSEVSVGAGLESFQLAVDSLISQGVNTIHLAPGAQTEELFRYAANQNLRFVGTDVPPTGLEPYWIASVVSAREFDLGEVISQTLSGSVAIELDRSLEISFSGLSAARLSHFSQVIDQLESGAIDPQGSEIE